jgi:aminomethyltransferase
MGLAFKTQLFEEYKAYAKIAEFAGYDLPLLFDSIISEHLAVRNAAGFFDVSHMGRFLVEGREAEAFLNKMVTVDVAKAEPGRAQYTFLCYENGGVMDDLITYKASPEKSFMVVNAANRLKDFEWLVTWSKGYDVTLTDLTSESSLISVQGPLALGLVKEALSLDLSAIRRFRFASFDFEGLELMASRTGYTGEDGFELMLRGVSVKDPGAAALMWRKLMEKAGGFKAKPCGLGARDTLRLEAGLPLYGNDLTADTTPVEAGLTRFVDLGKESYLGKEAHARQLSGGTERVLRGLACLDNAIPRSHCRVLSGGLDVGFVTSGTFSPLAKRGIALAYIPSSLPADSELYIDVRGTKCKAEVHPPPFYDPEVYGWRRKTA